MAYHEHIPGLALLEEAITVLFCEIDDAYDAHLNPRGGRYTLPSRSSWNSDVITLAFLQQLREVVDSERCSFLGEVTRFFSHLCFPKMVGLHPSSFHRRLRKLRRFLELLRGALFLPE